MDANGETLRKLTLLNIQQQAIWHSNFPHHAVDEPAVEVSHLPCQEEKTNPVTKDKHNIKNLDKNCCLFKLFLWKENEGKTLYLTFKSNRNMATEEQQENHQHEER